MALLTGINGVVKKASSIRQGVGGVVKTLTSGKVGVSGVVREFWGPVTPEAVEVEVLYIEGHDIASDGSVSNKVTLTPSNASSHGSVSFTSNSVTLVSKFVGKWIFVECRLYYVLAGRRIPFQELNNSSNSYSCPFSLYWGSNGSGYLYYRCALLGVEYPNLTYGSSSKTVVSPNALGNHCYMGIGQSAGSGVATWRATFNNITINGKSFTPKIVSVPSGWTAPT